MIAAIVLPVSPMILQDARSIQSSPMIDHITRNISFFMLLLFITSFRVTDKLYHPVSVPFGMVRYPVMISP